jgi:hypothetical protein
MRGNAGETLLWSSPVIEGRENDDRSIPGYESGIAAPDEEELREKYGYFY